MGINTLSAHMPNFVTGKNFYDTSGRVVSQILPGGTKHAQFNAFLDRIAKAVKGARRPDGTLIPVIFRPFHENNGGWFWWGAGHTTSAEYIEIFRYTVEYLRDTKGVRNLLYSYSPNSSFGGDPTGYLKTYPGDGYVDVLGYDAYDNSAGSDAWLQGLVKDLAMVARLAEEKGKVPAYTEFGESGEEGRNPQWFTKLLGAIKADPLARRMTYMQTWANFGGSTRSYVPTPGHALHADFVRYAQDPYTVFAGDLRGVYAARTTAVRNAPFMHLVTPTDQRPQRLRQQGQVGFGVHDPVQHADGRTVAVQRSAERRERRRLAECEDIGRRRDLQAGRLLRGHEGGGPHRAAGGRVRGSVGGHRDAEVDHPGPVRGQQHVRRLQVAVHDARLVDGLQRLGHPRHQPQHRRPRQRPAAGDRFGQGRPGHVQRGQPGRLAVRVPVDQLGGVRAPDPARRLDLPAEPPPEVRVVRQLRPYDLDRHRPAALRVRQVDHAHPARAEPRGKPETGHCGRIVRLQWPEDLRRMAHRPLPLQMCWPTAA
ncbi:hypothetical protein SGLAM104S_02782 [Streptomyces glaucescens]